MYVYVELYRNIFYRVNSKKLYELVVVDLQNVVGVISVPLQEKCKAFALLRGQ